MDKNKIVIFIILVGMGIILRLLPHPWNFTPIAAIALFAGVYLGKRYALSAPLLAMLVGDVFLGFYEWKLMAVVYASFAMAGLIGVFIRKRKSIRVVASGTIAASTLFFLVTNFAVWQFSHWYPKTLAGLIQCYAMALPFFRSALLGDMFYVALFFGIYEMASAAITALAKNRRIAVEKIED
jgi:hypothetical protein